MACPEWADFWIFEFLIAAWPSASKDHAQQLMHCIKCQGEHCLCGEITEV